MLLLVARPRRARQWLPRAVSAHEDRRRLPTDRGPDLGRGRPSDGILKLSEEIFLLPDVGEGLVEAEIVEWKVKVGDAVTLNQPLVDIETAKATVELPSPYAGTIVTLHGNPGDVIEVHQPLITFEVGGDASGQPKAKTTTKPAAAATIDEPQAEVVSDEGRQAVLVSYGVANEEGVATRKHRRQGPTSTAPEPAPEPAPAAPAGATAAATSPGLAPRPAPPVLLHAKQHGVDLAVLKGT